jgi:hypothetical protein
MRFAAYVTTKELKRRNLDPALIDAGVLGISVPQSSSFYGLPWLTGLIGAKGAGGPTVSQACATSVRSLLTAASDIDVPHRAESGVGSFSDTYDRLAGRRRLVHQRRQNIHFRGRSGFHWSRTAPGVGAYP